jgi:DNA-binding MarR family transcriptional regulator
VTPRGQHAAEPHRPAPEDHGPTIDRSDIDGQVLWTLVRAAYRAERLLMAGLADLALSPIQFGVLSQLAVDGAASNAQLARLCFVRPQTMAGVVTGMADRGLLARAGPGGRGRPSRIAHTPAGTELFSRAWPLFLATNATVTRGLPDDDARRLNAVLHRLAPTEVETGT